MKPETRAKHFQIGQDLYDHAVINNEKGDFQAALDFLNQSDRAFKKIKDIHWITFLKHEKIRIFQRQEQQKKALKLSDEVIRGYQKTRNKNGLALFLTHLSMIYAELPDLYLGLKCLKTAETLALKTNPPKNLDYIYSNMAILYIHLGNYAEAIKNLKKAVDIHNRKDEYLGRGWCQMQIGICCQEIFLFEKTEQFFQQSYQSYLKANDPIKAQTPLNALKDLFIKTDQSDKLKRLQINSGQSLV
ncbi:MAG: tetratricopeptide repeat protein [Deltaproteobacteria bacterium]|nr:tetratricopeptide repeat protein [Deltaproteobacteria bacterium]